MRRRRLKRYWNRLKEISKQNLYRDQLLMKFGAAKKEAGRAASLVEITLPSAEQPVTPQTFRFQLHRDKLRKVRRQEGQYLLRSNLCDEDTAVLMDSHMIAGEKES
jgi:hypothetical protein